MRELFIRSAGAEGPAAVTLASVAAHLIGQPSNVAFACGATFGRRLGTTFTIRNWIKLISAALLLMQAKLVPGMGPNFRFSLGNSPFRLF